MLRMGSFQPLKSVIHVAAPGINSSDLGRGGESIFRNELV